MAAFSVERYSPMSDSLSNEVDQLDSAQKNTFFGDYSETLCHQNVEEISST